MDSCCPVIAFHGFLFYHITVMITLITITNILQWSSPLRAIIITEELYFFKKILFIYSWDRERSRERSRLHAGSPTWDSTLGPRDHTLGQRRRQTAEPPGLPQLFFFLKDLFILDRVHTLAGEGAEGEGQAESALSAEPHIGDHDLSQNGNSATQWTEPPRCPCFYYFLSHLYTQHGAQTHNPEVKSGMLH